MNTRRRSLTKEPAKSTRRRGRAADFLDRATVALFDGAAEATDFDVAFLLLFEWLGRMLREPTPSPYDEATLHGLLRDLCGADFRRNDYFYFAAVSAAEEASRRLHNGDARSAAKDIGDRARAEAKALLKRLVHFGLPLAEPPQRPTLEKICANALLRCKPGETSTKNVLQPPGVIARVLTAGGYLPGELSAVTNKVGQASRRQRKNMDRRGKKKGWSTNDGA